MTQPHSSLRRTTAEGLIWLTLQSVGGRAIGFVAQLALAAILLPADFGLIGLATTGSTIAATLVNFGVEQVLVQRQRTVRLWAGPAFWLTFGLGVAGALVLLGFAPLAARLYHTAAVAPLIDVMAAAMPFAAVATVPMAVLRAGLRFRQIAAVAALEVLLTQALTLALALLGFGALSFVLPLPAVALLRLLLLWRLARPDLRGGLRRLRLARYLVGSSLVIFATSVVQVAVGQGDYITLGLLSSTATVGAYFFAFKLAAQPLLLLASNLSNVLFPTLSQLRSNPAAQGRAAFQAAKMLGLVIMPMACLQAAVAAPALHLAFGAKWDASIPLMQILSIGLGFDAISWVAGTLLVSRGRFGLQLAYVAGCAVLFFALVVAGGWNGSATGVAVAVAAYYGLVTPVYSYLIMRHSGVTASGLVRLYVEPALLAACATGASLAVTGLAGVSSNLLQIALICVLSGIFYLGLLRLRDPAAFGEVAGLAQGLARRLPACG